MTAIHQHAESLSVFVCAAHTLAVQIENQKRGDTTLGDNPVTEKDVEMVKGLQAEKLAKLQAAPASQGGLTMTTETTCPLALPLRADQDCIVDAEGRTVLDGSECFDFSVGEGDANAAEIVRRVNLHDEAMSALRRVARLNENAGEIGDGMLRTIVSEARAVIAKLEAR